ncbi:DinB family protein [Zhouia spongiae]|uniref:DinB family protein n=1 Tax=Zhouia spongiae TaxID=2202721 RepID=A0ABY3YK11_9FLAO|nr:DinB family protein [Zhouia spongiae]UNY98167.1 DinB family protein [Zhouia spongiae]
MKATDLKEGEYDIFYANYIKVLGDATLFKSLKNSVHDFAEMIKGLPEGKLLHAYAPGKWTIAEVILHVMDAERIFQYRLLRIARNDQTNLPGFDENEYVPVSMANVRTKESLLNELYAVRQSSTELIRGLDEEMLNRTGFVMNKPVTSRAIAFIICGHMLHHLKIVRERYLK